MPVYRQGDVLIVPTPSIPDEAALVPLDNGSVILAYGEVTGHAHRICQPVNKARKFEASGLTFLEVLQEANLTHEEHTTVTIPTGLYQIVIQSEYTPGEYRNVAD